MKDNNHHIESNSEKELGNGIFVFEMNNTSLSSNKLQTSDRSIHDWYRFVLSFPPHLVRQYLERFNITTDKIVLDPFCGTGTTLVECKKNGIPSVGIEANPMAYFASKVKVDWMPFPSALLEHAQKIAAETIKNLRSDGLSDLTFFNSIDKLDGRFKKLSLEQFKLLLRNSISQIPLHKILSLKDCLNRRRDERFIQHEMLTLAKTAVESASNLHFGPEVGVGKPKDDAAVVQPWLNNIKSMAQDLDGELEYPQVSSKVFLADARNLRGIIEPRTIDFVFTSPPYPNEKDYTRTTRLESVLLDFIKTKADLRCLKKSLIRSNTRNVYKGDDDDRFIEQHFEIQRIAKAIETRRKELNKTSGFERMYARVTKLYFGGMARHFEDLKNILKPGAYLAYVVGDQASYLRVMIRTGQLLADIAKSLGYHIIGIDLFRTRFATATQEQLREEVVLMQWKG